MICESVHHFPPPNPIDVLFWNHGGSHCIVADQGWTAKPSTLVRKWLPVQAGKILGRDGWLMSERMRGNEMTGWLRRRPTFQELDWQNLSKYQILVFSWDRIPTSSNQFLGCWLFGSMVYASHAKLGQEPCLTTNWPLKGVPCAPRRVFGMAPDCRCHDVSTLICWSWLLPKRIKNWQVEVNHCNSTCIYHNIHAYVMYLYMCFFIFFGSNEFDFFQRLCPLIQCWILISVG